jgi:hypothetical protein
MKHILAYTFFTKNPILDEQINGVAKYIRSCYAEGDNGNLTLPDYMLPWELVKWVLLDRETLASINLDPYTQEALEYILVKRTSTNGEAWKPDVLEELDDASAEVNDATAEEDTEMIDDATAENNDASAQNNDAEEAEIKDAEAKTEIPNPAGCTDQSMLYNSWKHNS